MDFRLFQPGPRELRAYLADMVSPEKKKQMVEEKSWRPPKRTFDEKKVFALSETINANQDKFEAWRNRVLEHASIFTTTEIQVIFYRRAISSSARTTVLSSLLPLLCNPVLVLLTATQLP
jgi:hypothetical protein